MIMDSPKIEKFLFLHVFRELKKSKAWERLDYCEQENSDVMFFWHVQSFDRSEREQPSEKQYFPYNKTLISVILALKIRRLLCECTERNELYKSLLSVEFALFDMFQSELVQFSLLLEPVISIASPFSTFPAFFISLSLVSGELQKRGLFCSPKKRFKSWQRRHILERSGWRWASCQVFGSFCCLSWLPDGRFVIPCPRESSKVFINI